MNKLPPLSLGDEEENEALESALDRANSWGDFKANLLDGASLDYTTGQDLVALSLHHVSLSHFDAIVLLASHGIFSSAFALIRPLFESHVRGLWLAEVATRDQVDKFMSAGELPLIRKMIEVLPKEDTEYISRFWKNSWGDMCDYTHGGALQVMSRIHPKGLAEAYRLSEVAKLLDIAVCMSFMVVLAKCRLLNRSDWKVLATEKFTSVMAGTSIGGGSAE